MAMADDPGAADASQREGLRTFKSVQTVLGADGDENAPATNLLQMEPGTVVAYHTHDCPVMMLVIMGSLYVPGRILMPGDRMEADANEFYGPLVAGPDGCTSVEMFAALRGMINVKYQRKTGEIFSVSLREEPMPDNRTLAGMDPVADILAAINAKREDMTKTVTH